MRFIKNRFWLLLLFAILPFFLVVERTSAMGENQFITIVNPVRVSIYTPDLTESVKTQYRIIQANELPATWLLTWDVLQNKQVVSLAKSMDQKQEIGIFLEVTPAFAHAAGVSYNNSGFWHFANSVFLSGYTQTDRIKLIDEVFEKFKSEFGYYPTSVGAWWIDSYSLYYIREKYQVTANLGLADQFSMDGYQVWGTYWSTPFYPSRNHAGVPAQNLNSKIDVVTIQWAPRDPLNGYKDSKYSTQDYPLMGKGISYFEQLVTLFAQKHKNSFGQVTIGLESDLDAEMYKGEFKKQMDLIKQLDDSGEYQVTNMQTFSEWYRQSFPQVSPPQIIESDDFLGKKEKIVWYNSLRYRIGMVYDYEAGILKVIDFRTYHTDFQEPYFLLPNTNKDLTIYIPSLLDRVNNEKSVWNLVSGKLEGTDGGNGRFVMRFARGVKIEFSTDSFTLHNTGALPKAIKNSQLIEVKTSRNRAFFPSDQAVSLFPKKEWLVSEAGVLERALTPEAMHFIKQKKIILGLSSVLAVFFLTCFWLRRYGNAKLAAVLIFIGVVVLVSATVSWYETRSAFYWVSQAEIDVLHKLAALPPGRVLVFDRECLQCVGYTKTRPAAFINAREYVKKHGNHTIVYNASVFNAPNQAMARKEFLKQSVKYIYLVQYPFYVEKLPFSPGDLDVEKIYGNANAELWRVKD